MTIYRRDRKFGPDTPLGENDPIKEVIVEYIARVKELGILEYLDYFFEKSIEIFDFIQKEIYKKIDEKEDYSRVSTLATAHIAGAGLTISFTDEGVDAVDEADRIFSDPSFGVMYVHELQYQINGTTYVKLDVRSSLKKKFPELFPELLIEEGDSEMATKLRVHFDMLVEMATSERLIKEYVTVLVDEGKYKRR